METVFEAFVETAKHYAERPFLAVPPHVGRGYHDDGIEFTYGEVRAEVERLGALYAGSGYGAGHRVALLLDNRPEHLIHFLALNALGISCVPVNPAYRHDEIVYQLSHSEVSLAVALGSRQGDLAHAAEEIGDGPAIVDFENLPTALPPPKKASAGGIPGLSTEASLLYTSGTTGRPKGCILSNDYHLTAGRWYSELGGRLTIERGQERLFNPLPLYHMNSAVVSFVCMLLTGGCLIIPDRFHPKSWWDEVSASRATIVHYLGVIPPLLLNQPVTAAERSHRVKVGVGAGIEPALHAASEERFGFPFVEVWGMTETGRILSDNHEPRQIDTRAFGRPVSGLEARVVDAQENDVPSGESGQLLIRFAGADPRKGFFSGYLKNEEATREAWRGGWFHTGDTVKQAEDGMLYFVDRTKNIIRRSGENIAAAEVEAIIQAHEAVAQVAVLPVRDELREEEVLACIVPMPTQPADMMLANAIFDWCQDRLAYYKAPGWVLFVDTLPTTGTQKVQKTKIFAAGEDPRTRPDIIDLRQQKRMRRN